MNTVWHWAVTRSQTIVNKVSKIVYSSIVLGGKASVGTLEQVAFEFSPELISADGW